MSELIDIDALRCWIGREDESEDVLTPALAERFHATLGLPGEPPATDRPAPRLIHFCLGQPIAPATELGEDGHPARGGFMPPVPLPRRMWASGTLRFTNDLRVGDTVRRCSRIADLTVKHGRSGMLCFVTVEHRIGNGDDAAIAETQTIVYRSAADDGPPARTDRDQPAPQGATTLAIQPDPTLLFRYSALTFNGHRIHYDRPYAVGTEGYPGLVVHGPLQATLLLHLAQGLREGCPPDTFEFRGVAPAFDTQPLILHATPDATGMQLWTASPGGPLAMSARAGWT